MGRSSTATAASSSRTSPVLPSSSGSATCPSEGRYELVSGSPRSSTSPPRALAREVEDAPRDPLTPITVKTAVGEEQVNYLYEHQAEFPGVEIAQIYLRDYAYSALAAQILGYTGEISPEELKQLRRTATARATGSARPGSRRRTTRTSAAGPGCAQIRVDSLGRQRRPRAAAGVAPATRCG